MENVKKTPVALVVLAWLFVGVPWGWGVAQLWKNAQKLFQSPAATAPATTAPAPTMPASTTPAAPQSK